MGEKEVLIKMLICLLCGGGVGFCIGMVYGAYQAFKRRVKDDKK